MSKHNQTAKCCTRWRGVLGAITAITGLGVVAIAFASAGDDPPNKEVLTRGAELFAREWLPGDGRGSGGDGLGPVYNETSCVACHHQGGPGGAGPTSTNVEILTARSFGRDPDSVADLHPGFRTSRSIVLHRYGVDPEYTRKRLSLLVDDHLAQMAESVETEIAQVQALISTSGLASSLSVLSQGKNGMALSQRNPPALFGVGKIDAISEETLIAAAEKKFPEFPEIRGRVNRQKDGRIGRFGWKAETPDLREFVLSACANELGLEVPGHHQAASPLEPDATAKGLDLTQVDCDALVSYVRDLGAPAGGLSNMSPKSPAIAEGRAMFDSAGCAACHRPSLGDIEGIYSDLLLHDMGPALSDSGSYYGITEPDSSSSKDGVKKREWRTPPLWGFRDSAPYLHDGRAKNLDEAVALHGGQAKESAKRFFKLHPHERLRVQAFLRSLSPPEAATR
jgi:CxxC motif-containing protein (DUF1111 family)